MQFSGSWLQSTLQRNRSQFIHPTKNRKKWSNTCTWLILVHKFIIIEWLLNLNYNIWKTSFERQVLGFSEFVSKLIHHDGMFFTWVWGLVSMYSWHFKYLSPSSEQNLISSIGGNTISDVEIFGGACWPLNPPSMFMQTNVLTKSSEDHVLTI